MTANGDLGLTANPTGSGDSMDVHVEKLEVTYVRRA
jgi:hypothetical protein